MLRDALCYASGMTSLGFPMSRQPTCSTRSWCLETGVLQRLAKRELQLATRLALDSLPQLDRDVLIMRFLEQMSAAEVAEELNCTPGAIATRQYRAVRRLRELLIDTLEESQ